MLGRERLLAADIDDLQTFDSDGHPRSKGRRGTTHGVALVIAGLHGEGLALLELARPHLEAPMFLCMNGGGLAWARAGLGHSAAALTSAREAVEEGLVHHLAPALADFALPAVALVAPADLDDRDRAALEWLAAWCSRDRASPMARRTGELLAEPGSWTAWHSRTLSIYGELVSLQRSVSWISSPLGDAPA